jgi:ribosomal-protein-alanine N-acetyltransferase
MLPRDLPEVVAIERGTFPIPWTHANFLHEIENNPFACNRVVRSAGGSVEAYASSWIIDGEVRINNLAVSTTCRRKGRGEALVRHLMEVGRGLGCRRISLEVRPSNAAALRLYDKLGFKEVGRRKNYYSDTHEDALVMRAAL